MIGYDTRKYRFITWNLLHVDAAGAKRDDPDDGSVLSTRANAASRVLERPPLDRIGSTLSAMSAGA